MKPSEILEKAAAHMERVGLHKGYYFNQAHLGAREDAPCCALGAIGFAAGKFAGEFAAGAADHSAAANALRRCLHRDRIDLWNDAHERTQAEVVAKLREAAELARKEGR